MTIITFPTARCMQVCGLNYVVDFFNVKTYDIWEENMTIRIDIYIENIHSLGFQDIRGVTIRKLILWSLECNYDVNPTIEKRPPDCILFQGFYVG